MYDVPTTVCASILRLDTLMATTQDASGTIGELGIVEMGRHDTPIIRALWTHNDPNLAGYRDDSDDIPMWGVTGVANVVGEPCSEAHTHLTSVWMALQLGAAPIDLRGTYRLAVAAYLRDKEASI